eukprot:1160605-Pelagomonas_calceolata.AAC.2
MASLHSWALNVGDQQRRVMQKCNSSLLTKQRVRKKDYACQVRPRALRTPVLKGRAPPES